MIRVLVVEDSPTIRDLLLYILSSDPEFQIVGTAETGEEAVQAVKSLRPDVVTMDVHMPKMNGFDATRQIMETRPTPIIIVSGTTDVADKTKAFRAMEAGALALLQKPFGIGHPDFKQQASELVRNIKLMSEVKVVRRWPRVRQPDIVSEDLATEIEPVNATARIRLVAIGASTGGPPALHTILSGLPRDFSAPILIVQHIAAGFTQGFVEWLAQSSTLPVHLASHGEPIFPGHVYVAPDGLHMEVKAKGQISLNSDAPENGLRPSVSHLFRSVANSYREHAVGVLLTGMGKDGAAELKNIRDQGGVTIAQNRESAVVNGMPGEAIRLGGAAYVLPPEKIRAALTMFVVRPVRPAELDPTHDSCDLLRGPDLIGS